MNSTIQKLITEIETQVTVWNNVTTGKHVFGGKEFLFQGKEIGHIHQNGDLDILFGKSITAALLRQQVVQQHQYMPHSAITYRILQESDIPFAVFLLRFSYLLHHTASLGNK